MWSVGKRDVSLVINIPLRLLFLCMRQQPRWGLMWHTQWGGNKTSYVFFFFRQLNPPSPIHFLYFGIIYYFIYRMPCGISPLWLSFIICVLCTKKSFFYLENFESLRETLFDDDIQRLVVHTRTCIVSQQYIYTLYFIWFNNLYKSMKFIPLIIQLF